MIGTGLEESVVAAAASRVGHSVLHIDPNNYYGDVWAAFTFDGLQDWIGELNNGPGGGADSSDTVATGVVDESSKNPEKHLRDREKFVPLTTRRRLLHDLEQEWFVPDEKDSEPRVGLEAAIEPRDEGNDGEAAEEESGDKNVSEVGQITEVIKEDAESKAVTEPENAEVDSKQSEASTKPDRVDKAAGEDGPDKRHSERPSWSRKKIAENSRHFNLDLTPKLLFSRGSMVELLISSNISRYTEFKSVSRVLTLINGALEHVPSSRADVFATKRVSVVEKRILMKFLTACMNEALPEDVDPSKQYKAYLKQHKLTDNLIHFVLYSIAMVADDADTASGLAATHKFLTSLGRFGNTPFLWSMYGSGEMPQAFCRLCAVFGGTYYLGRTLDGLVINESDASVAAVITNGERIDCKHLVMPAHLCPPELASLEVETTVGRTIALSTESLLPAEREQLSLISLPPKEGRCDAYTFVQEVGPGAAACPKGLYCLQVTSGSGGKQASQAALSELQGKDDEKEKSLQWSLSFDLDVVKPKDVNCPPNLYLCNGPRFELDYDQSVDHAKRIFGAMYPSDEFLPRAPEPEEIIIGEQEEPPGVEPEQEEDKAKDEESRGDADDPAAISAAASEDAPQVEAKQEDVDRPQQS